MEEFGQFITGLGQAQGRADHSKGMFGVVDDVSQNFEEHFASAKAKQGQKKGGETKENVKESQNKEQLEANVEQKENTEKSQTDLSKVDLSQDKQVNAENLDSPNTELTIQESIEKEPVNEQSVEKKGEEEPLPSIEDRQVGNGNDDIDSIQKEEIHTEDLNPESTKQEDIQAEDVALQQNTEEQKQSNSLEKKNSLELAKKPSKKEVIQEQNNLKEELEGSKEQSLEQESSDVSNSDIQNKEETKQTNTHSFSISLEESQKVSNKLDSIASEMTPLLKPEKISSSLLQSLKEIESPLAKKIDASQNTQTQTTGAVYNRQDSIKQNSFKTQNKQETAPKNSFEELKARVLEQVKQKLKLEIQKGNQSIKIQLNPKFLGKIHIQIQVEEQSAKTHFLVETQSAQELLQRSTSQLQQDLKNVGVESEEIEVEVALDSNAFSEDSNKEGSKSLNSIEDQKAAREWLASFMRFEEESDQEQDPIDYQTNDDQLLNVIA